VQVVLRAWRADPDLPRLWLLGEGPLREAVEEVALNLPTVSYSGFVSRERMAEAFRSSSMLIFPSIWYEGFPMVILEAMANGLPIIASRMGAMAEVVRDGQTGLLFEPGNHADLATKVRWLQTRPADARRMGHAARLLYESEYTPERNLNQLLEIYGIARANTSTAAHRVPR
jgi:glycosyltransferase involved in cell wall biosynthesis